MTGAQDGSAPTFQKLLKCKILYVWGVGGQLVDLTTFDAESKSAKIQNSLCVVEGGRLTFQLLMLSPNLLKSKISYV